MDRDDEITISDHGERRFYMRDQMGFPLITRFGQMNLLACPGHTSLIAIASLGIIGGIEAHSSRRKIFRLTPP